MQPEGLVVTGVGEARTLVEAVLEQARSTPGIRIVQLTVTRSNAAAIRLYESCGFFSFGTEPYALRYGKRFAPLVHVWCAVGLDTA